MAALIKGKWRKTQEQAKSLLPQIGTGTRAHFASMDRVLTEGC